MATTDKKTGIDTTTALVLARPERQRILRQLLSLPEPWNAAQRSLYREVVHMEWMDCLSPSDEQAIAEIAEKRAFCKLILQGVSEQAAREMAVKAAHEAVIESKRESGRGRMNGSHGALSAKRLRLLMAC